MRMRAIVAVAAAVVLLLPDALIAQRLPIPGRRPGPGARQPMPPESGPIARQLSYRRLRISVESYPLVSFVQSTGLANGGTAAWASLGAGTSAEYRLTPLMSATLDLTSSFLGGPIDLQTAELGARFGRARTERRLEPFADVRLGYTAAMSSGLTSYLDDPIGYPIPHGAYGSRYSNGWGGVAGAGLEYGLSRMFSITTEVLGTHSRMTAHDVLSAVAQPSYSITSLRWVLGLKYNPVRMVMP